MNVFSGEPSDLILAESETLNEQTRAKQRHLASQVLVDLVIQAPDTFHTSVIASNIPLQPLKVAAPALLKYLTTSGSRIVLPWSEAIDANLLIEFTTLVIDRHNAGGVSTLDYDALPQDPVQLIKLHVILELFGLYDLGKRVSKRLWKAFKESTLTLAHVLWIWGALTVGRYGDWLPRSAETYLQMMAWGILNADAQDRLDVSLRTFFMEEEGQPPVLTRLLEKRYSEYGLQQEKQQDSGQRTKRRGQTHNSSRLTSLSTSEGALECDVSVCGRTPIFPMHWQRISETEGRSSPVLHSGSTEVLFSHGKWDGKVKNVKKMAAERNGLVHLRVSEAFKDRKDTPPTYSGR